MRRDLFTVKIIRLFGTILSFSVLVLMIQWTVNLYERDIEDLPLILALQDEIRIKPENKSGMEISFTGLSVNSVLDESVASPKLAQINLAPISPELLANEVSPVVSPDNHSGNDITSSITNALESLLGITKQFDEPSENNIELHIASYSTADKANAHWFLLQQINSDLLVNYNHQVVKVTNLEKEIYRLRVVGFESVARAQDMCARLIERGEKCVPAVGSQ